MSFIDSFTDKLHPKSDITDELFASLSRIVSGLVIIFLLASTLTFYYQFIPYDKLELLLSKINVVGLLLVIIIAYVLGSFAIILYDLFFYLLKLLCLTLYFSTLIIIVLLVFILSIPFKYNPTKASNKITTSLDKIYYLVSPKTILDNNAGWSKDFREDAKRELAQHFGIKDESINLIRLSKVICSYYRLSPENRHSHFFDISKGLSVSLILGSIALSLNGNWWVAILLILITVKIFIDIRFKRQSVERGYIDNAYLFFKEKLKLPKE